MVNKGELSDYGKKAIAGYMDAGTSLPAFGNPNPLSFLRLVPHQEAPTSLCWSYSNRSALVRVPLGWINNGKDMAANANPLEKKSNKDFSEKQTFEWRASDGCADMYLLMAALCAAARHGFEMTNALEVAEKTYVGLGVNIHDDKNKKLQESLEQLPDSCVAAAKELAKDRKIYTEKGVFSDAIPHRLQRRQPPQGTRQRHRENHETGEGKHSRWIIQRFGLVETWRAASLQTDRK